jgi:DNA-binding beta-propeller fold protein YncE
VRLAVLGVAAAATGCGAGQHAHHLAGAEPAVSPAPVRAPAGRVVSVGAGAEGIVADPTRRLVAVAIRDPPRVALLSARSGRVLRRLPIAGAARHLQVDWQGTLLVPEATRNRLLELPLSTPAGPRRSIVTGSLPHDAAAADGHIFVTDEFGHAVTVVAGDRAVGQIGGFVQPGGVARVGGDAAVVDVGADTLTLIDGRTLRSVGRVSLGSGLTHDAAGRSGRVYVVDTRGDALFTLRTRPRLSISSRLPLPGTPYGIASDPAHDRLWVTETATDRLVELDIAGPRPRTLAVFTTIRQPNSVAVDPRTRTVFVASATEGTVQVLSPATQHRASIRPPR